jgi:phosphoribosylanthranilate isomerase
MLYALPPPSKSIIATTIGGSGVGPRLSMVKVKICGFTEPEDVVKACRAGADMIGVIVDAPVRRSVTPERAVGLFSAVPKSVSRVAVMVPNNTNHAIRIVRELMPDYLQTHGSMTVTELEEAKAETGVQIIAVVNVPQKVEEPQGVIARAIETAKVADFILVDTEHAGAGGGTGLTHDWKVSRSVREAIGRPLILAGGLNPGNVREAIKVVKPYGVDVASGVESEGGKKNPKLMREFILAAKGV